MRMGRCIVGASLLLLGWHAPAVAQPSPLAERVAQLKASLAASKAGLTHYEWIETTLVSFRGEEKSRKVNRCYYGADGGVTKVPVAASPPPEKKRGLRGKIVEAKKEELTESMQQAVALVRSYVPPSPERVQALKDAGKVSLDIVQPGQQVRVNLRDYAKPGDLLAVEIDVPGNRLLGLSVKTYLADPGDAVSLDAKFAQLADGISYADAITLVATRAMVKVNVDNSGYRKTGN